MKAPEKAGRMIGLEAPDRGAALRTNAPASVPQRRPRFPDTPWGRLRRGQGWSLRELSRRTGVSPADLSRIERGIGPSPDHASRLLAAFAIDQIAALDRDVRELEATTRWLLIDRLLRDGHAQDIKAASLIANDPARLRELYPDAFDEVPK